MRKNPHAIALGALGGRKNTPAQQTARNRNIAHSGGRPPLYRVELSIDGTWMLERRASAAEPWQPVDALTPAALAYLTTWLRLAHPQAQLERFEAGRVFLRNGA